MKRPVQFLPEATAEFATDAEWYEQRRSGLGADFLARVREVIGLIAENPAIHKIVYLDVRKAAVPRFPYVILYREEGESLLVISVFHTARKPSVWKSRI